MATIAEELTSITILNKVAEAKRLEESAMEDYSNGKISEQVVMEYMNDTEAICQIAVNEYGICWKDINRV